MRPMKKVVVPVQLDPALVDTINRVAELENLSLNQLIEKVLAARFDPRGEQRALTVLMHQAEGEVDEIEKLQAVREQLLARLRAVQQVQSREPREQMITLSCYGCNMKISTLGKWIEDVGIPHCPKCEKPFVPLHPEYH